jgi:hypothetical protein
MRRTALARQICVVFVALMIAGCGIARQYQAREQTQQLQLQAKAANDDCNAKFPMGNPKIEVARVQCLNSTFAILMPTFGPDQDLAQVFMADRLVIAEQIQGGKIDLAEGNAEIAAKWSEVVSESQQRQMARQSVAAQEQSARAASLAALARSFHTPTAQNCTYGGTYGGGTYGGNMTCF